MSRSLLLLLAAALLLAGCASFAPYDYGLELQVIKMDERMRELLAASRTRPLIAVEAQAYLHDSLATLQLLHDRAFAHQEQSDEAALVDFLRHRMQALAIRKSRLTRTDLRRLAYPIADLREMESMRSSDYRQVPLVNINAYDYLDYGDFDVYAYHRDHWHDHGDHWHGGDGGHGGHHH